MKKVNIETKFDILIRNIKAEHFRINLNIQGIQQINTKRVYISFNTPFIRHTINRPPINTTIQQP